MESFEDVVNAWDNFVNCLLDALGYVDSLFADLATTYDDAQSAVEARNAERKRWGHPPKKLFVHYPKPVTKVRPNARSRVRNQRRA